GKSRIQVRNRGPLRQDPELQRCWNCSAVQRTVQYDHEYQSTSEQLHKLPGWPLEYAVHDCEQPARVAYRSDQYRTADLQYHRSRFGVRTRHRLKPSPRLQHALVLWRRYLAHKRELVVEPRNALGVHRPDNGT